MPPRHIVIVGAGIVGAASAYLLTRAGHPVTVLDANDTPGEGASQGNGAQLSYSYVEPLASPATLRALPGYLLAADSPLKLRLSTDPDQIRWGWRFLRACRTSQVQATTEALLKLAARSRDELHQALPSLRLPIHHRRAGKLVVVASPAALHHARQQVARQAAWGCVQTVLDTAGCLEREPALAAYAQHVAGGVWTESEEVGDCHLATRALLEASVAMGATWRPAHRVTGWVTAGTATTERLVAARTAQGDVPADAFVLAGGAEAPALARPLGLRLPLAPIKGYSITLPIANATRAPATSVTDLRRKLVYARLGDRLRVAGMAELVGHDRRIDPARIRFLQDAVEETFPGATDPNADPQPWAGLRPATPTGLPLIGRCGPRNLFLNLGQGALGWTLALGSARVLAAALAGEADPLAETFAPRRFVSHPSH
ncbi:MAG: D-amino acid dehydrogenase [Rubrivivax sp.]|jgi:D-amino-acid dehydrogenase